MNMELNKLTKLMHNSFTNLDIKSDEIKRHPNRCTTYETTHIRSLLVAWAYAVKGHIPWEKNQLF